MKISVVIPLYNKEIYIYSTIQSVINQNTPADEILVIDDGSTDNSADIVKNIKDSRIRLIQQANAGECAARNRGLAESCNELVAFLDADDEWKPGFLTHIHRLYNNFPDCGVYATGYEVIQQDGKVRLAKNDVIPPEPWIGILPSYFRLAQDVMPFNASSVAVVRSCCLQAGGFPVGVKRGGDLMMWILLAVHYPIAYSPSSQAIYHTEAANRVCDLYPSFGEPAHTRLIEELLRDEKIPSTLLNDIKDYYSSQLIVKAKELLKLGSSSQVRELLNKTKGNKKYNFSRIKWHLFSLIPKLLFNTIMSVRNFGIDK